MMKKSGSVAGKTIRRTIVSGLLTTGCLIGLSVMDGSKQLSRIPVVSELLVESAHAEVSEQGTFGGCDWQLEDGVLTISKSANGDGKLTTYGHLPWMTNPDMKANIYEIVIEPGVVANENSNQLFRDFQVLRKITGLPNLNVDNVTQMVGMFFNNPQLEELDITGWNTQSVQNMRYMFADDPQLTKIQGISNIDTSNVEIMDYMFSTSPNLVIPSLNWNTAKVTSMRRMFQHNEAIKSLTLNFNTEKLEDLFGMFKGSHIQNLNLSSFKTDNVRDFREIFGSMSALQVLDISSFDTKDIVSSLTDRMLEGCNNLWKVRLGKDTRINYEMGLSDAPGDDTPIPGTNYVNTDPFWVALAGGTENNPRGERDFLTVNKLIQERREKAETYVWQQAETPDQSAINVNPEVKLFAGQEWHPRDGFVSAVNRWGDSADFEDVEVSGDTVKNDVPGTYNVTYTIGSKSAVTKVVIVKSLSKLEVKPEMSLDYGAEWDSKNGLIDVKHHDGSSVDFEKVKVSGDTVNSYRPGKYTVTYSHNHLSRDCVVTVKNRPGGNGNSSQGNNGGSETSTPPSITSPDHGSGSTSENQPNPETNLPGTTQANEASKVPYRVYARRTIRLHRNVELTNPVKSYKKLPRHKAHSFKILGVAYSQNGIKRYRVKGGYITANKKQVVNQYYQSKPARVKIIHPKGLHQYRKANLTGKIRHVKKGQVLKVKKVIKSDKATRLQLSNGSYITANKRFMVSYK